jgi:hypothetical protein
MLFGLGGFNISFNLALTLFYFMTYVFSNILLFSVILGYIDLKNNGEIIKLSKGIKQNFSIQGLEPALKNGGKIWTYTDLNYIYILDSLEKRIIIIDKNGNLKSQIKAGEFEKPSDMVIDEENKVGFVVDTSTIFKITLPI